MWKISGDKTMIAINSKKKISLFIMLSLVWIVGCVPKTMPKAQDNGRLDLLEQRIFALEQQKLRAIAQLKDQSETFRTRVDKELKNFRRSQRLFITELEKLKQDIELITNDNEVVQNKARKNGIRLKRLERRLGNQIIALNELKDFFEESVDVDQKGKRKDEIAFNKAHRVYKKRNFTDAEKAFMKFRVLYPKSPLVDDATYFIGYIRFLQGQYDRASLFFQEMLEQFPHTNRRHDAKWWLGVSYERSGDINAAMDVYKELLDLPAQNPIRVKAELRLEDITPLSKPE